MKKLIAGWLSLLAFFPGFAQAASTINWPQFRGPQASGFSEEPAPERWNIESGENIRWQTPIPGLGHASPIIWSNRIYVASAVNPEGQAELKVGIYGNIGSYNEKQRHEWHLLCLDKHTGRVLWDKVPLATVPRAQRHTKASHCNSTPATDGRRVVAIFGSEGLYCFDMDGRQLWQKDLGPMDPGYYAVKDTHWSFGSSPIMYQNKVIVQCDVSSEQFLAAFDVNTGREVWRTARKDVPTWCTPTVAISPGRAQIILNGMKQIGGYDLETGEQLWHLAEGGDIPVPTPIVSGNLVIFTSGHGRSRPMRAVRLDASGDITPADISQPNQWVVWCDPHHGNYLQTPIVVGDLLWGNLDGVTSCFDVKTGNRHYNERIGGGGQGFTASPVAAKDRIYFTGEQGDVFVLPASAEFSVLATNKLGGLCLSTPAISEGTLYFRTVEKLVAVGSKK